MVSQDRVQEAKAILAAINDARRYLRGAGTPKQRRGNAQNCLYSYRNSPILGSYVRDVCQQTKLSVTESALNTLENLARGFAEAGSE